jgi:hypothetical protein
MELNLFLELLFAFSTISALITQGIKKVYSDKANLSYNLVAIIIALIVGGVGCGIYYQLNGIPFTTNNIIYMLLMGGTSGLVSMYEYDKVKQTIKQIVSLIEKD